ncbi:multiple epidermal growth factor-like domains protein 8 [Saccoglossus kowalevskii]|uniref:Multiple epidermal growth factor-like domains protein 8-like n=1 Tax=Saccoglossus kowalevskii TaxID=10224 RepID=A0ABM0MPP9_SACKO|nr:PREDICTED: multiple epidermal growth factor-like domains protein 8-like [Saccoglossus kowalevskii]
MVAYTQNTLLMFGGTLADGTISNELWSFIVTVNTGTWQRQATTGNLQMPGLTDHTACIVDDRYLYIYGGRSESVNFMSKMYRYDFTNYHWEEVNYRGGTISDLRVSGHSMVYHPESRSLIVFGGFKPRYSRRVCYHP